MSFIMDESMALLLEKYSPQQVAEVLEAVLKMTPAAPVAVAASSAPVSAITSRKKRNKKSAAPASSVKSIAPVRPLNSWMAFRSYLSPIFKSFQQKDISGLLTRLWQEDPFKAKWSILAKAYSIIREHKTKNEAPLDKFLGFSCPHIGMIPRDEYLSTMGWEVFDDAGVKRMQRRFTPDVASFSDDILTTNFSAEDIVVHCYQVSYIEYDNTDIARTQGGTAALTMAAQPVNNSAQPFINSTQASVSSSPPFVNSTQGDMPQSNTNSAQNNAGSAMMPTDILSGTMYQPPYPIQNQPQAQPQAQPQFNMNFLGPQPQQDEQDDHDIFVADSIQEALNENNNKAAGGAGPIRQTVHDLSSQQYPFMEEFDPYKASSLNFDPWNLNRDAAFSANSASTYLAPSNAEFPETFNIDDLLNSDLFDLSK